MSDPTTQQPAAQPPKPPPDDDYLGYGDYADTLWARILAAVNKDASAAASVNGEKPLGDDPLVVGIFGEWGAGKSRLLKLIERKAEALAKERAQARQANIGQSLTVPVFFQPWKYEHEAHLLLPLLLHILIDLERILTLGHTSTESVVQSVHKTGDAVIAFIPQAIDKLKGLFTSSKAVIAVSDPSGTAAIGMALAGALAAILPKLKKTNATAAKNLGLEDDGRSYYEIHKILKQITRPQKHEFTHPSIQLKHDIRINFVIFIDDLDRCLPEKAVETLELIKTIFNAESFAFVLALDEEVVERGIGHRYRDYNFEGKKPEMPITGFEYLEKIVHLPFRLPALTQGQAVYLLEQHEAKEVIPAHTKAGYTPRVWMGAQKVNNAVAIMSHSRDDVWHTGETEKRNGQINLAHMVVNCFDIYVPRKLIRTVELFHQVLSVLQLRKREGLVNVGHAIDPRLLMAFVLLQLFQPDLYRACKRSLTGFEALLQGCMAPDAALLAARPAASALSPLTADVDLLHWALQWHGAKPPATAKSAHLRVASEMDDRNERNTSQRILLPIAERILEHRHAQRHAFDPLRLMVQLRPLHDEKIEISSRMYFSLLALTDIESVPNTLDLDVLVQQHIN